MIKEDMETEINKILRYSYESGIDLAVQEGNPQMKELVPYEGELSDAGKLILIGNPKRQCDRLISNRSCDGRG